MTPAIHLGFAAANPWLPSTAVIEDIVPETPGVATYRLRLDGAALAEKFEFQPGQFNMLYLPGWGEAAISMSGAAHGPATDDKSPPFFVHTIRAAGRVTRAVAGLGIGGRLAVRGPFGKPWPMNELNGLDVVLVAGGIGLAPLRPVIYELHARRDRFGRCVLLCGARSSDNLLYSREYSAWSAAGLEIETTVDRPLPGWNGNVGVVPLLIDRLQLSNPNSTAVLMCGPEVMMRFSATAAISRGIAPERIWVSLERHMQCAIGLCGHCQLGTELLCRDGPVFRWDRVEPLLQIHNL